MSDFSKPEYASYVALCRELRLERHAVDGDRFTYCDDDLVELIDTDFGDNWHFPEVNAVWLPSLSDWLEMLEEASFGLVAIERGKAEFKFTVGSLCSEACWEDFATAPTREEAAARLWMAVRKPAEVGGGGRMRGIERLEWLEASDPHLLDHNQMEIPRVQLLSPSEVSVHVARALIEELHDALAEFRHPIMVITNPVVAE